MPRKTTINIKSNLSPARRHERFLKVLDKQGVIAYRIATMRMIEEIKQVLTQDKLMKSDKLGVGWTGEVNQITVNLNESISKVINKYLSGLRWVMLGDYAGKEAKKVAKELDFTKKMVPGLLQAAYLDALDAHRMHYLLLFDKKPGEIPPYLIEYSIEQIVERTNRYLNQVTMQLENNILNSLQKIFDSLNNQNTIKARSKALGNEDLSVEDIDVKETIPKSWFEKEMRETVNDFRPKWKLAVDGEIGLASATATHQAMHEIFGGNTDDDIRVVWLTARDERVCKFCNHISTHPNGEFKYYKMSDFKPAGWNIGRKRANWGMSVPPAHPNCRCSLVYVPPGFNVTAGGLLVPNKG